MEFDFDFLFFSAGIFISLPIFWSILSVRKIKQKSGKIKTLVVLGSGGHTAEMLRLVTALDLRVYCPLTFVLADTDLRSEEKLKHTFPTTDYEVIKLPRAREVSQSWLSTVISFLKASKTAFWIVYKERPEFLLCNGPGTCVPLCWSAWILNKSLVFSETKTKIVYVESVCRVKTLSLSAKMLLNCVDEIIVQWEELTSRYPKTKYLGRFI